VVPPRFVRGLQGGTALGAPWDGLLTQEIFQPSIESHFALSIVLYQLDAIIFGDRYKRGVFASISVHRRAAEDPLRTGRCGQDN